MVLCVCVCVCVCVFVFFLMISPFIARPIIICYFFVLFLFLSFFVLVCFLFPCFVRVCISLALFNSCGFEQAYRLVYFYLLLIYSRHRPFTFFLLFVFILIVFRRFIFQTRRPIIYLAICLSPRFRYISKASVGFL